MLEVCMHITQLTYSRVVYVCMFMYVCMFVRNVCMFICMYVCSYVCMNVYLYVCTYVCVRSIPTWVRYNTRTSQAGDTCAEGHLLVNHLRTLYTPRDKRHNSRCTYVSLSSNKPVTPTSDRHDVI